MPSMKKYYQLLWTILLTVGTDSCTSDKNLHKVQFHVYPSYRVDDTERMGLLEYEVTMTLHWNISGVSDDEYDGILYRLSSYDKQLPSIYSPGPSFGHNPCQNVTDMIWTMFSNGSYGQCQVPCKGIIDGICIHNGICTLLSTGYKSLDKNSRNISLPIRFAQRYYVQFYLYRGWRYGKESKIHLHGSVVFCHHELKTQFKLEDAFVEKYCGENQDMDGNVYPAGPISNLEIVEKRLNMSTNRGEMVMKWQDPHDKLSAIIRYDVNARNAEVLNYDDLLPSKRSSDGYYRATFINIKFNEQVVLKITPVTDKSHCTSALCKADGYPLTEIIEFDDIDGCTKYNEYELFCVNVANCKDHPPSQATAASCTCPDGYLGNGINPAYLDGTGCEPYDMCANTTWVREICVDSALCEGIPSPYMYINCSCPEGFIGNGFLNGTGCTYDAMTENAIIAMVCIVSSFVIVTLLVSFYCRKKRRELQLKLTSQYHASLINTINSSGSQLAIDFLGVNWKLESDSIELKGVIGRGNFGVVHKAIHKTDDGECLVAVKMITEAATEENKRSFKHEILLLSEIDSHENVLGLVGCCMSRDHSLFMVTPYMKYGDLLHFLWRVREAKNCDSDPIYMISEFDVYEIAGQVACGMQHLKKRKIIHGDLAARNILVGEGLSCKISDFGLANDVYVDGALRNVIEKTIPLRWVSPERMMDGRVPIDWRSDVWSYGILLYEAVTLGATPYPGIESKELFAQLKSGYRMTRPLICTQSLYDIMLQCWEWRPSNRPSFEILEKKLKLAARSGIDTYVNLHTQIADHDFCNDTFTTGVIADVGVSDRGFPESENTGI